MQPSEQPTDIPADVIAKAVDAMTQAFIANGADPDDAKQAADYYVREAIRQNKIPGFETGTTSPPA